MNGAGTIGPNCWKQILGAVIVDDILQLLAVARKEDCPRARSVTDADDIALEEWRAIRRRREWLVVSTVSGGLVGNRRFVEA
jgi:Mg/Co/Ni transporter MgtE